MAPEQAENIQPQIRIEDILPRRLDRFKFDAMRMLSLMGAYGQEYRSRPLQFLVDHAQPQTDQAAEAVEEAKNMIELDKELNTRENK